MIFTLLTCTTKGTKNIKAENKWKDPINYSDKQILEMSEDCEYVFNLISNGMKVAKKSQIEKEVIIYSQNTLLVKILGETACLNGQSLEQVKKRLGKPSAVCLDEKYCMATILDCYFLIVDKRYYLVTFVFQDNLLIKTSIMSMMQISSH